METVRDTERDSIRDTERDQRTRPGMERDAKRDVVWRPVACGPRHPSVHAPSLRPPLQRPTR